MATVTSLYIYIIYISITLIPYHLIFLLHVNLFLSHVLCLWHLLLGYPTSVVEGVGDEFINVRENLIT